MTERFDDLGPAEGITSVEVWIEESDLVLIEAAAIRDGVVATELIGEAVHRAALSLQFWMNR